MFGQLRPAIRELWEDLGFLAACVVWSVSVLLALLLARHESIIAVVALTAASPIVAVPPWRRHWKEFLLLAVSMPVFLCVAESVVRLRFFGVDALVHPLRYQPIGAMSDPDYLVPALDPRAVYTYRPGFEGWVKGVVVKANSLGLRDREPTLEAHPGTCRVITLGTSVTMGEGVRAEAVFPSVTERLLRTRGFDVEVLNFGVGGYHLASSQALLESVALRYRPSLVVQELPVTVLSETERTLVELQQAFEKTRATPPRASVFERNSLALYAIYPPVSLRQRIEGLLSFRAAVASADGSFAARALDHFGSLARKAGFRGVVFVPRPMYSFGIENFQREQRNRLRAMAEAAGLIYIDSYDRFSAADEPENLIILPGDLHPNAEGHRRHADALVNGLLPTLNSTACRSTGS